VPAADQAQRLAIRLGGVIQYDSIARLNQAERSTDGSHGPCARNERLHGATVLSIVAFEIADKDVASGRVADKHAA